MKIITKKSVIFTALAVVLLATALVISCTQLDGVSDKEEPSKPGTGKARLSINTRNASRTILPAGLPTGTKYLLILDGGGVGNTNGFDGNGDPAFLPDFSATVSAGTNVPVSNIPIGTYQSAQVFVYVKTDSDFVAGTDNIATLAIGEAALQTNGLIHWVVTESGPNSLGTHAPTLYPPGSKGSTGLFSYNITNSANRLATATFVVKGKTVGTVITSDLNSSNPYSIASTSYGSKVSVGVTSADGASANIPSGYYNVIFTLTDTDSQSAKFLEILQVYKGMESVYTGTFVNDIFPDPITPPPSVGNGGITITPPDVPAIDATLSTNDTTNVVITTVAPEVMIRPVTIKAGSARSLIFTVNTPSSGIGIDGWYYLDDLTTPISNGNGVTVSGSGPYTISFDTSGSGGTFPLPIDGTPTSIVLILTYTENSVIHQFSMPTLVIKFN